MAIAAAQQVASVSMAEPIGSPFMNEEQGDRPEMVVLVAAGCVIAIGVFAANFIDWRRAAVETAVVLHCKEQNPVQAGRGSDSREGHNTGITAGSRGPLRGTDTQHDFKYGVGQSTWNTNGSRCRPAETTCVATGAGDGSSML